MMLETYTPLVGEMWPAVGLTNSRDFRNITCRIVQFGA